MWSPNPFAIAQLLLPTATLRGYGNWKDAQSLLTDAFKIKEEMIFDPDGTTPPAFQVFRDFMEKFRSPHRLDDIMRYIQRDRDLSAAAKWIEKEKLRQVLPFLVPVTDCAFARPGTHTLARDDIAKYDTLGPFVKGSTSYLDPGQGLVADCYLISSMIALAWAQPVRWKEFLDKACLHGPAGESYRFEFTVGNGRLCRAFDVQPWVPIVAPNQPYFAWSADIGESWPSLVEKAFVMHRCKRAPDDPMPADYQYIGDDFVRLHPGDACRMLIGGNSDFEVNDPPDRRLTPVVRARLPPDSPRMVTTVPTVATTHDTVTVSSMRHKGLTWTRTGLLNGHCYAVLGMMKQRNVEYVVLRNPHGVSKDTVAEYAKDVWKPGAGKNGADTVTLNQKGVFAIPVDWFEACFFRVDWVDLKPAHP